MSGFFLLAGLAGLAVGSFINALEWRLRHGVSLWETRSKCPACKNTLRALHIIPVASFLALRGRCAFCRARISWQYPLVELWMAAVFVFLASWYGLSTLFFFQSAAAFVLTLIFVYDAKYQEIPDSLTVPAMVFFAAIQLLTGWESLPNMLLASAIGGGVFLLQYLASRGRWIGGGDIRLGVLMGVLLGFPNILLALLLAYISGAAVAGVLLFSKKKQLKSEIAFGTFLSAATLFTMVFGSYIVSYYLLAIGW